MIIALQISNKSLNLRNQLAYEKADECDHSQETEAFVELIFQNQLLQFREREKFQVKQHNNVPALDELVRVAYREAQLNDM